MPQQSEDLQLEVKVDARDFLSILVHGNNVSLVGSRGDIAGNFLVHAGGVRSSSNRAWDLGISSADINSLIDYFNNAIVQLGVDGSTSDRFIQSTRCRDSQVLTLDRGIGGNCDARNLQMIRSLTTVGPNVGRNASSNNLSPT